jgi:NADH-quinone oxidoreductase subunit L
MTIPLVVLAVLSVVGGLVQLPHVFGGHPYFSDFLKPVVPSIESADAALATKEIIILAATIIGLVVIYFITKKYYTAPKTDVAYTGFRKFLANKWYVDELYDSMISKPLALVSKFFNGVVEKKGVDGFVNGVGRAIHYSSRQLRLLQSGNVGAYILLMVAGIIILFVIQLFFSK